MRIRVLAFNLEFRYIVLRMGIFDPEVALQFERNIVDLFWLTGAVCPGYCEMANFPGRENS